MDVYQFHENLESLGRAKHELFSKRYWEQKYLLRSTSSNFTNYNQPAENVGESMEIDRFEVLLGNGAPFVEKGQVSSTTQLEAEGTPFTYYRRLIDDEIIDEIVARTNAYGEMVSYKSEDLGFCSRNPWYPTKRAEMIKFIGLLGYIGLVKLPSLQDYWSTNWLYKNWSISDIMTKSRFELLLAMWHFSERIETACGGDVKLIDPLIYSFNNKCQFIFTPGDRVMVSREVLLSKTVRAIDAGQVNKSKGGISIISVRADRGYTWNMQISLEEEKSPTQNDWSSPTYLLMQMTQKLLDFGRIVHTDSFFTSVELAKVLLDRRTFLIGPLSSEQWESPARTENKLSRGEIIMTQNDRGVTLMKWQSRKNILMLSTIHQKMSELCGGYMKEPQLLTDYEKFKTNVNAFKKSTNFGSYCGLSMKWYKKIAVEILLNTSIINAFIIYEKETCNTIPFMQFKEGIIEKMLKYSEEKESIAHQSEFLTKCSLLVVPKVDKRNHRLLKLPGSAKIGRKYCRGCYDKKLKGELEKNKVKKVTTFCADCESQPRYCSECFHLFHK